MRKSNVCIIGSGHMGKGISILFAKNNYAVHLIGSSKDKAIAAKEDIKKLIMKSGRFNNAELIIDNIHPSTVDDIGVKVDLFLETVTENVEIKKHVLSSLSAKHDASTILATNTSSIPIAELSKNVAMPERLIGIHFMNPAYKMKGVEVICGPHTNESTVMRVEEILRNMEMESIRSNDVAGFMVNRILMVMINKAISLIEKEGAKAAFIDDGMKKCCHLPMGPLELADFIGLDTICSALEVMHKESGELAYKPSDVLIKMVSKNHLGRKTGQGFYSYDK